MLKTVKLTKDQLEPFLKGMYQKTGVLELMGMIKEKEKSDWDRLGKQIGINLDNKHASLNHKKKTLAYFDEEIK